MKYALLSCHDEAYDKIAKLSFDSFVWFAEAHGIDYRPVFVDNLGPTPYLFKLGRVIRLLDDYDYVIYSDVDVLFNPGYKCREYNSTTSEFLKSDKPIMASQDSLGLCAGFMTFRKDDSVLKLLEVWKTLGYMSERPPIRGDQSTLKLLVKNFKWIGDLVGLIPQTAVSNPECGLRGSVAHHFWANGGSKFWGNMVKNEAQLWADPVPTGPRSEPVIA